MKAIVSYIHPGDKRLFDCMQDDATQQDLFQEASQESGSHNSTNERGCGALGDTEGIQFGRLADKSRSEAIGDGAVGQHQGQPAERKYHDKQPGIRCFQARVGNHI